jgi:GNAT superfamily N-acetyltransferase
MLLAPFPAPRTYPVRPEPALRAHGLSLRGAVDADLPALCALYASTREELATLPWPAAAKDAFVADQFRLQHLHYVTHYPEAHFLVLEAPDGVAGRFYHGCGNGTASDPGLDLLIDVSLMPRFRGQGIGSALLRAAIDYAASRGRGVALHVHAHNRRARQLYERLGFVAHGDAGLHVEMRRSPAAACGFS